VGHVAYIQKIIIVYAKFWSGNLKGRDYLGDVGGKVILK